MGFEICKCNGHLRDLLLEGVDGVNDVRSRVLHSLRGGRCLVGRPRHNIHPIFSNVEIVSVCARRKSGSVFCHFCWFGLSYTRETPWNQFSWHHPVSLGDRSTYRTLPLDNFLIERFASETGNLLMALTSRIVWGNSRVTKQKCYSAERTKKLQSDCFTRE